MNPHLVVFLQLQKLFPIFFFIFSRKHRDLKQTKVKMKNILLNSISIYYLQLGYSSFTLVQHSICLGVDFIFVISYSLVYPPPKTIPIYSAPDLLGHWKSHNVFFQTRYTHNFNSPSLRPIHFQFLPILLKTNKQTLLS